MKPELQQSLQQSIDNYLAGKLNKNEIEDLWVELLKNPEAHDYLTTAATVKKMLSEQKKENQVENKKNTATIFSLYSRWIATAAAVLLVITILYNLRLTKPTVEPINFISMAELEVSAITRSGEKVSEIDSLINLGVQASVKGDKKASKSYFESVINQFPDDVRSARAYFNLGMLIFNDGDYKRAAVLFSQSSNLSDDELFLQEKSYWFLANTYINLNNLESARDAAFKAYQLNGDYRRPVFVLLKQLDMKLGYTSFDEDIELID